MSMLNYFDLKRKYNELLTKYDIADEIPALVEKKVSLSKENDQLEQRIYSKKEELEALNQEIERLQKVVGSYRSLEELEARKKMLLDEKTKKFATSKLIIAVYNRKGAKEFLLDVFAYNGQITYLRGLVLASEYQSLSGSLLAVLKDKDFVSTLSGKVVQPDNKKIYNAEIKDWISFEEVCKILNIPLYLENEVTYEEIMEILNKLNLIYNHLTKYSYLPDDEYVTISKILKNVSFNNDYKDKKLIHKL